MGTNEEKLIRSYRPEQAVADILGYITDVIVKRQLTEQETKDMTCKIRFWFYNAFHKGKFAMQDSIEQFSKETCKRIADFQYTDAVGSNSCKVTVSK